MVMYFFIFCYVNVGNIFDFSMSMLVFHIDLTSAVPSRKPLITVIFTIGGDFVNL